MKNALSSIKAQVLSYKGQLVHCRRAKGRNRFEEAEGVVLDVYPHVFTLYDRAKASTVAFSYTELLTRDLELEIVN